MDSLECRISNLESNKMDVVECNTKLQDKVHIDSLEGFMQNLFELKASIDKTTFVTLNSFTSQLKLEMGQKITLAELDREIDLLASKEELEKVKSQLGNFDLNKYTDKINHMIDKKIKEVNWNME